MARSLHLPVVAEAEGLEVFSDGGALVVGEPVQLVGLDIEGDFDIDSGGDEVGDYLLVDAGNVTDYSCDGEFLRGVETRRDLCCGCCAATGGGLPVHGCLGGA